MTAGSTPTFSAIIGSMLPTTFANSTMNTIETLTVAATAIVTLSLCSSIPSSSSIFTKFTAASVIPQMAATRHSFHMTRNASFGSVSPRDRLRITAVDACAPELPPVPISMGMKATSPACTASISSNFVSIMLVNVADSIRNISHGMRFFQISIGVDRMVLQVLSAAYREEQLENGESRVVLAFPPALAPVKVAVMPLVKKDGLPDVAQRIIDQLKYDFNVVYDEKDSIGKRYRRQDAVGTPFCVTVDHQTLEDGTVTVRHRDTMQQERVAIDDLYRMVDDEVSYRKLFRKLNL